MSILEEFRRDEARVLDRLVDGEIGPADRCELLSALDDEPGAWRRCALAFLESQNWRQQLSQLAIEPLVAGNVEPEDVYLGYGSAPDTVSEQLAHAKSLARRRTNLWVISLATAASLIVAIAGVTRFASAPSENPSVVKTPVAAARPVSASPVVTVVGNAAEPTATNPEDDPNTPLQTVKLALAGDGEEADEIDLPVAEATTDDQTWPTAEESTLPASLYAELRKAGLEVVRRQRVFPIDLSDGRRLMVPVEQVDIRSPSLGQSL